MRLHHQGTLRTIAFRSIDRTKNNVRKLLNTSSSCLATANYQYRLNHSKHGHLCEHYNRALSTQSSRRLNEDNMKEHHMSHVQDPRYGTKDGSTTPHQLEWTTMFEGKIPVLKQHEQQEEDSKSASLSALSSIQQEDSSSSSSTSRLSTSSATTNFGGYMNETPRTSVLMELTDRVGVLHDVLRYFWKYDVNVTRIESRPVQLSSCDQQPRFDFFVDFDGSRDDPQVEKLLSSLQPMTAKLLILDEKEVQWFPRHISELDLIADRTLDAGDDLESDHPGFHDQVYRKRRSGLTQVASKHTWNQPIQRIDYTQDEIDTWGTVWDRMESLLEQYACKQYLHSFDLMKEHCGYSRDSIPQQEDISQFLKHRTNFRMRPVSGLLSSRDFLNGLAFRVFFSTQYIRHHSKPLYTPEPDICHELLGHAPMFADRDFADFSQEIGLASLGASDEDVQKLARCYWHSVEFGLCKENGQNKAYGAGLLSSFGELEYACHEDHPGSADGCPPEIKPWDPAVAAVQEFPITTYQPVYFLAESLQNAKHLMRTFCEDLHRPFFALYNDRTETVFIDRPVRRTKGPKDDEGKKGTEL